MAAAGGFDIAQFEQIILALMSPDNNMRNQAEEALRQAKQSPETLLPAYVQLLRTHVCRRPCRKPLGVPQQPPR